MKLRNDYIERLKAFEGLKVQAYKPKGEKNTNGVLTIGYGHLGARAGETITESEADALLRLDIARVEAELKSVLPPTLSLSDDRYTALVDFVFNCGISNFKRSTLFRLLRYNPNDWRLPNEFMRWVYSGKVRLQGLVKRRQYCKDLWLSNK